ncbi:MAG: alpha-amylase family glycosyl hydrolase [bacterium]
MRYTRILIVATTALAACKPAPQATDTTANAPAPPTIAVNRDSAPHPAWSKNSVIYEVNIRQYTPEGTIAAAQKHLQRLKQLGIDMLWVMPVQPIGKKNRKGVLGSYYAVSDYRAINPEFGTKADFKAFVDAAHDDGLKVLLDWVPNHTAFDHTWITAHKDYYVTKPDGTIINARDNENHDTDWTDVAELNYDNPEMRKAMIADMRYWVDSMNIDGFRADVAGGVPIDFWVDAKRELQKSKPDLFLLAESEDPKIHAAFDMTYGWELHHLLNEIAQGKKSTAALTTYFAKQDTVFGKSAYRMYFTSNHDENSWNGSEFERMGANHMPAYILAATVQNSMPMLYTGQEVSLKKRLRFFEKDTVDWKGPSLASFYHAVFALKHHEPALANGQWGGAQTVLATNGGDRVYAFTRTEGTNTVLTAVNFGDAPVKATYQGLTQPGDYTDWFSTSKTSLAAQGSLTIPAHGYRVLVR